MSSSPQFEDEVGPHHKGASYAELTSAEMTMLGSGRYKTLIVQTFRAFPDGLTDWELVDVLNSWTATPVAHTGVVAQRNRLMRLGWVLPTGRTRTGPYGKPNEIFVAIPEGCTPIPVPDGRKRPLEPACAHEELGETYLYQNSLHPEQDEWRKDCLDCDVTVRRMSRAEAQHRSKGTTT